MGVQNGLCQKFSGFGCDILLKWITGQMVQKRAIQKSLFNARVKRKFVSSSKIKSKSYMTKISPDMEWGV